MLLATDAMEGLVQFITVILLFILVFAVTIIVTRWIARYQKVHMTATNMTVVDSMRLSPTQCIQIVKIGDKYVAMALSKDNVTYLCELKESELVLDAGKSSDLNFAQIFRKVREGVPVEDNTNENLHEND